MRAPTQATQAGRLSLRGPFHVPYAAGPLRGPFGGTLRGPLRGPLPRTPWAKRPLHHMSIRRCSGELSLIHISEPTRLALI
eukprot:2691080-Alexandrium_andersonii.AAC.1